MINQEKIGKFIAELRKENGLTQNALAAQLYVDRSTISKWESGTYIASPETLLKLSEIFDVTINEILVGERLTEDNKDIINQALIEILKDNISKSKKIKKLIIFTIVSLLSMILIFLSYYFINNYNSISVYKIAGDGEQFSMLYDGVMILSKEKAYIRLGEIVGNKNKDYNSIRLYYIKNNEQINLIADNNKLGLLTNDFSQKDHFPYSDIKYIKENLYLEISYDNDKKEIIKLNMNRDFANINIIGNKIPNKDFEKIDIDINNITKYFKNNFEYNSLENQYYLKTITDNKIIEQKYFIDSNTYIVEEFIDNFVFHYEYSDEYADSSILYYIAQNDIIVKNCHYNYNNYDISDECDDKEIQYFIKNYLTQFNE